MENEDDLYLSDWLSNKITDIQLKELVSEEDFLSFVKLKNSLENYSISNPDMEKNFEAIKTRIQSKKKQKTKIYNLRNYISIAASIVFFVSSFIYFSRENNFETGFGQKQNITLADDSQAVLNSKSKLCYTNFFMFNRNLELKGEAFFKVKKGSKFTVNTSQGKVEVLGTKFNVNTSDNFFEVICYEGKVRVTFNNKIVLLTNGESIRNYKNKIENWVDNETEKPSWINNETSFKNTPIKIVFAKIENQYGYEIDYPVEIENIAFTGTITHNNSDVALKSLCIPLHLKIKTIKSNKIEIVNE